jgi:hypothetical protein
MLYHTQVDCIIILWFEASNHHWKRRQMNRKKMNILMYAIKPWKQ